jgi:hypothetical protein
MKGSSDPRQSRAEFVDQFFDMVDLSERNDVAVE